MKALSNKCLDKNAEYMGAQRLVDWIRTGGIPDNHPGFDDTENIVLLRQDELRQVIWRWLQLNVWSADRTYYRNHSAKGAAMINVIPWHEYGLDDRTPDRIHTLYNFIQSYPQSDVNIIMKAYRMRLGWFEIAMQMKASGFSLEGKDVQLARYATEAERWLKGSQDIDGAVSNYESHLHERHYEWLRAGSSGRPPQFPTETVLTNFRKKLTDYVFMLRPLILGNISLDARIEQYVFADLYKHS